MTDQDDIDAARAEAVDFVADALARRDRLLNASKTARPVSPSAPEPDDALDDAAAQIAVSTMAAINASGVCAEILALIAGLTPREIDALANIGETLEDRSNEFTVSAYLSEVLRLHRKASDDLWDLGHELAARRRRDDGQSR